VLRDRFDRPWQMASIFFRDGGHTYDVPQSSFSLDKPRQQCQEAPAIQPVGLRASRARRDTSMLDESIAILS